MTIDEALRRECASQTRKLEEGLVAIEQDADDERVADLFRVAHSLKGNCGMAGLEGAKRLAHAVEDLLSDVRSDRVVPEGTVVDVALAAVDDIAATLDGEQPAVSAEERTERLRTALADARERSAAGAPDPVDLSSLTLPPADPDEDISVEEALERASQFDDLDSLAEAIDDASEFADLEGGGSFDDLAVDRDDAGPDGTESATGGPSEMFDRIKAEVEQEDTDSLQRALEEVRFGEFDDEDDVTIQELIDLDPTEDTDRAASPAADAADAADGAAFADSSGGDAFADMPGTDAAADAPEADADTSDEPPTAAEADDPDATREPAERDAPEYESTSSAFEAMKSEVETGDVEQLESDLESVRFGEFDDEDDVSIQDLVEGTVDAEESRPTPEEPTTGEATADADAIEGFPDLDAEPTAESAGDEPAVEAGDADAVPAEADPEAGTEAEPETGAEPETPAVEPTGADDPEPAAADDPEPAVADDPEPAVADDPEPADTAAGMEWSSPEEPPEAEEPLSAAEDIRSRELPDAFADDEPPSTAADEPVVDEPVAAADEEPSAAETSEADAETTAEEPSAAESTTAAEEPSAADSTTAAEEPSAADVNEAGATEPEVPDLDLPDLDVVTPPALDEAEVDSEAVETDPGFERDASTVEFESRFADLLGSDATVRDGEDEYPRTALTIADSALDADQFQAPAEVSTAPRRTGGSDDFQSISVDVETADSLLNLVEELSMLRLDMEEAVGRDPDPAVEESLTDLQGFLARFRRTVMDVRLMPLRSAVEGLPRVVRDVAQESDADVTLETVGTDVKLDRSIIDRLRDPLVHLVRNAVDHGIEPPEVREADGKPREGRITVEAERVRDRVEITVSDDGRGIDPGEVREAAIDQGVLSPEAAHDMDRQALFDLLFRAGFTTTTEVTSVSGRGVGMDVVHRVVSDLDGEVSVESTPGEGTTVTLSLPVTVAVTEVLFVESGTEQYGIPVSAVEQVSDPGSVVTEDGTELIEREPFVSPADAPVAGADAAGTDGEDGEAVERHPLVRLAGAFDVPGETRADGKVVWVRPGEQRLALHCDRVREAREVVVKPYEEFLAHVPGISGATMLGNGSVVNIIDVQSI